MFHVKQSSDGPVAAECYGADLAPDWRVERRPDGSLYWLVTDWQGETVAHGVRSSVVDAIVECVRWST